MAAHRKLDRRHVCLCGGGLRKLPRASLEPLIKSVGEQAGQIQRMSRPHIVNRDIGCAFGLRMPIIEPAKICMYPCCTLRPDSVLRSSRTTTGLLTENALFIS